jgi:hypothetical protein
MRKIILLFLPVIFFTSCQKESFISNFDSIEYYSADKEFYSKFRNRLTQKSDTNYIKILENDLPKKLDDSLFYSELNSSKFIHSKVSKSDVNSFKELFNDATFTETYTTACSPDYRNILILKKSNKIIGVLKICYGCEMYYLISEDDEKKKIQKSGGIANLEIEKVFDKYKAQ